MGLGWGVKGWGCYFFLGTIRGFLLLPKLDTKRSLWCVCVCVCGGGGGYILPGYLEAFSFCLNLTQRETCDVCVCVCVSGGGGGYFLPGYI